MKWKGKFLGWPDGQNLKNRKIVFHLLLLTGPFFLERVKGALGLYPDGVYFVFTFDSMNILHFGISNLLKTLLYGMLAPKCCVPVREGVVLFKGLLSF